ncbi:kinase-like protein, partial [Ramicandelaber brevisporus]
SSTPQVCLHVRPPGYIRQAFGVPISNLGSGTGGSVTLHRHPWTGNQLAIKKFKFPPTMPSELRTRIVSSEAGIALPLSHPNIIKTYAYVHEQSASAGDYHFSRDDDGSYYCIMEAQPQDVFPAMLTARYNKYFVQMVNAVHYLHTEKGIAHRDLKLDNFVLTHDDAVKLLDFGCATRLYPSLQYQQGQFKKVTGANVVKSTGVCGSDPYIAPEVLQCSGRNGAVGYDASKADVWSLAIIYLAMRSCHFPWNI